MDRTPDLRAHLMSDPSGRLFLMFWGGMAVIGSARLAGAPAITQIGVAAVLLVLCSLNQPYWAARATAGWRRQTRMMADHDRPPVRDGQAWNR